MVVTPEALKQRRIAEVIRRLRREAGKGRGGEFEAFARQYYQRVAPEDIASQSSETLYGAARSLWRFGQKRMPGRAKIRAYDPDPRIDGWSSSHTIVEIIHDDMPFLVDSVTMAVARAGVAAHFVVHPVLLVERAAQGKIKLLHAAPAPSAGSDSSIQESWMHICIDHQAAPEARESLVADLDKSLANVRAVVADWRPMLGELDDAIATLESGPPMIDAAEMAEAKAFLAWMKDDNFTLLGYREFDLRDHGREALFAPVKDSGKGLLRDPRVHVLGTPRRLTDLPPEIRHFLKQPALLHITKTSVRSTVHRAVHMDYVGVKSLDAKGRAIGEHRFIGLFTSTAYSMSPSSIPVLRRKVRHVVERSRLGATSHAGKALLHILETFPRDELLQISEDELYEAATGILHLSERPRIRLFVRSDRFKRFASCLVFVPREQHTTALRRRFEAILAEAFRGRNSAFSTQIGDDALARLHFIIGRTPSDTAEPNVAALEAKLVAAARTWREDLEDALIDRHGAVEGRRLTALYGEAFPTAYREVFDAANAVLDIDKIEGLGGVDEVGVHLYAARHPEERAVRFKIYHPEKPVALSDSLPVLEHMGLRVLYEWPYRVNRGNARPPIWIHDFEVAAPDGEMPDLAATAAKFEDAVLRIWRGEVEDDRFNGLVFRAGLEWRDVVVLRAYAKYLHQANIPFSPRYLEDTLCGHPAISRNLVKLFHARFDPAQAQTSGRRASRLLVAIDAQLEAVANLDEDRILRWFRNLVQATLRTNFYQRDDAGAVKNYVAFKLDSRAIEGLPLPRPHVEVTVYSPRVEAIHLRGGRIARGGIRWSDRREDFRTEVLGLMKAQMVKNSVIVPVGSKGGFVTKRLPATDDRQAIQNEVIASYVTFMSGLLDLTDNLVDGAIAPPRDVVRHDEDDPYLVVAADKGTATFSDIANDVSQAYGFWLGDAFASGGSAGYDHKRMGITARGAWESVKRHFRELGLDTQTTPFSVVGIGDMGGDVFGNGMLLSPHIRLVAAFNHQHIFVDPDPDAKKSYAERKRLFALPRSSWSNYKPALISKGGGVFDRAAKSIKLSPEIKRTFDLEADSLTPADLIRALLKAPVDLLWFGGIGTYVKAVAESDADAGDRANDGLRIDARALRCRVIGEGANLGITQRGRIEFALGGGRVNTDFVDNSAGVDCSDHEVNIKILLNGAIADRSLVAGQRNRLLARMTDEVGDLVLRDNYLQAQAISVCEAEDVAGLDAQARLMHTLERAGALDRAIEFLPDEEAVAERQAAGRGLTRPEISVLVSYSKITLFDALTASDVPEDPYFANDLALYFPRALRKRFAPALAGHRLRREIVATVVANSIVNRAGPTFVSDLVEETGAAAADIARAYTLTRDAFALRPLWLAIEALDNKVPAALQVRMFREVMQLIHRSTEWYLRNRRAPLDIAGTIAQLAPGIAALDAVLDGVISEFEAVGLEQRSAGLRGEGVPADLARRVARLDTLAAACHVVEVARLGGRSVAEVARVYFALGARLGLDWLRAEAEQLAPDSPWERRAVSAILEDFYGQQRALTSRVFDSADGAAGDAALAKWEADNAAVVARSADLMASFRSAGGIDVARLAIANRHVRGLIVG